MERAEKALNDLGDLYAPRTWVHRGGKQCTKLPFLTGLR
jgi:ribosomal protein L16 Arg81 hydroxylase